MALLGGLVAPLRKTPVVRCIKLRHSTWKISQQMVKIGQHSLSLSICKFYMCQTSDKKYNQSSKRNQITLLMNTPVIRCETDIV